MIHLFLFYYLIFFCLTIITFCNIHFSRSNILSSSINNLLKSFYLCLSFMFLVELVVLYSTINFYNNHSLLEIIFNISVLPRFLLSINFTYIALSINTNFTFNKKLLFYCGFAVSLYIFITLLNQEQYIEDEMLHYTLTGKVVFSVEIILKIISIIILLLNKQKFIIYKKQYKLLFIYVASFFLLEFFTFYITIIQNTGLPITFKSSNAIIFKLLFSPFIFILINVEISKIIKIKKAFNKSVLIDKGLSIREIEVLVKILLGYNNIKIQDELSIAKSTLKTHINKIFSKLNVSSRLELIYLFIDTSNICSNEEIIQLENKNDHYDR